MAVLFFATASIVTSCKHDPVLPEQKVSFASQVQPIFFASCQHSGCHGTVNPEFPLITYDDIVHGDLVVPSKPHESEIYEVITATDDDKMPRSPYPALTDRQIRTIFVWIAQGAENN